MKKKSAITLTLLKGAEQFGVSRETLRRALAESEIEARPDGKYSIRELHRALAGDARTERARLTRLRADTEELELRQRKRELIPLEEAQRFIVENFACHREFIVSQPGRLALKCNPTDPNTARAALEADRDEFLKFREKYPPREGEANA
jgi:hypothetical protein